MRKNKNVFKHFDNNLYKTDFILCDKIRQVVLKKNINSFLLFSDIIHLSLFAFLLYLDVFESVKRFLPKDTDYLIVSANNYKSIYQAYNKQGEKLFACGSFPYYVEPGKYIINMESPLCQNLLN